MNDLARTTRSSDLAALAKATDANGNVDLTAFEAQRLIYRHESIDGLDAKALVRDLTGSSAYATPGGKEQVQPLLDAIAARLPPDQAMRVSNALDQANVTDTLLERRLEVFSDDMQKAWSSFKKSVGDVDTSISDALSDGKRWADRMRDNPDNGYLERAAGNLASGSAGKAQELYGQAKGASTHGVAMLGEVVDLAAFGARFTTDRDFRNLIIGAGLVYASETYSDPSKPIDDVRKVAVGAWNEWQQGLRDAQAQGKEQEYLGQAQGAVGIELLAAVVPATKLAKLGKIADAVDGVTPDAAGQTGRRVAGEATKLRDELVDSGRRAQSGEKWESDSADLMFSGLAGVKRSQGELRELVDDMRAKGKLDGLLASGALNLRELNYLARQDISVFDGNVSFDKALEKWVGGRKLSELSDPMVGDMGEAIVAHKLAREGYRDLVPIQNNSGHGNDLTGFNPDTNRWEVVEVKASVQGIARKQGGDPDSIIVDRLQRADDAMKLWAPKNMWEEQAAATATRMLKNLYDPLTEKLDIDPKWVRVNIERDTNGRIHYVEPEIEKWKTPEERKLDRQKKIEAVDEATPTKTQTSVEERKPDTPQKTESRDDTAPRKADAVADDVNGVKAAVIGAGIVVVATPKEDGPHAQSHLDTEPHKIDRASEATRDAQQQAQREANRDGLSQEDAQRVVQNASPLAPTQAPPRGAAGNVSDGRDEVQRDRDAPSQKTAEPPATAMPPDFAPSLSRGRDLRDPQHEGNEAYREMQNKVGLYETQRKIEHGPHSDQMAASMLQFAVDNKLRYSDLYLEKNQDAGQTQLRYAPYGAPEQRFDVDLGKMASQPIDASSQRINSAVSPHYGSPAPALERTQAQSQWMSELGMDDRVSFARVRGGAPGHISDEHVMAMTVELKKVGMDASSISQVSMLGDQLRVQGAGEWGKTVLLDVSKPAPPLQDSVNAVNTLDQQQTQRLAQQQNNPTQDDPTPKGPKL